MYEQLLKCSIDYDADISVCGVINDHLILKKEFKYFNGVKVFSTSNEILDAYFKYPYLGDSSCNKLYKAELWENIRFPEIKSREDIAILYKIYFSCNKIVRIGDCKYIQYIRPGSTEQKAFTEDKLVSIDIAKNQAKYIKDNYPEYYKNVEDIVLRRYVGCLEEIVGGGYLKNKKVFDKVLKNYMDEIEYYNFNADKKYINPVEHRIIFILKVKISYIKRKIINNIKNRQLQVFRMDIHPEEWIYLYSLELPDFCLWFFYIYDCVKYGSRDKMYTMYKLKMKGSM